MAKKTGRFVWGPQVVMVTYIVEHDEHGQPQDVTIVRATQEGKLEEIQSWWEQPLMMNEIAEWNPMR
jgi:hypothetical protein